MLAGLGLGLLSRGLGQTTVPAPAQVLDLTQWKLTLPTGNPGSPTEILQPALGVFAATNYFTVLPAGNGVVFTAPCGGVTTSGSSYPRSELRQMDGDGTTLASWSTLRDTNIMEVIEAVLNLPVARRIDQISVNLERWRWLPDSLPADRVVVNVPGAMGP